MARRGPHLCGWCSTARAVEEGTLFSKTSAREWHLKCKHAVPRPDAVKKDPVTEERTVQEQPPLVCECPCNEGREVVVVREEPVAVAKVQKLAASGGGRNKGVREAIAKELQRAGKITIPKTGDAYEDRKIACRIHSAASSVGLKVKTSLKDPSDIVATVK